MVTPSPTKKSALSELLGGSARRRVTTGNTDAPCAIIGERMAEILKD
jgi:hypothetical protein